MVKRTGISCDGSVNPAKCLNYFSNFILVINASSGFFVYCFIGSFGKRFMEVLTQHFFQSQRKGEEENMIELNQCNTRLTG